MTTETHLSCMATSYAICRRRPVQAPTRGEQEPGEAEPANQGHRDGLAGQGRNKGSPAAILDMAGVEDFNTRRNACRTWRADRKSTRLNSSHVRISYAVFCLKKKKVV